MIQNSRQTMILTGVHEPNAESVFNCAMVFLFSLETIAFSFHPEP